MNRKLSTEEFVEKANIVHNNKYEYFNTTYSGRLNNLIINCGKHGLFKQMAYVHLRGQGCPQCATENRRLNSDKFIKSVKAIHGNKYDYSNTVYITARNKINIICPMHGIFKQRPYDHLNGSGCPKCVGLNIKTNGEFINESKKIFENKFEYNNTKYVSSRSHVIITCKLHGDFNVTPNNHLSKQQGCPICKESKGEEKISNALKKMNIPFIQEKTFQNCIGKRRKLPFDFYLPKQNLVIEYDGKHHFEVVDAFGGEKGFDEIQQNDKIKNRFLIENNIKLLRIPYIQYENIENILRKSTG